MHPFSCYAGRPFVSAVAAPVEQTQPAWWFAFVGNKLLVEQVWVEQGEIGRQIPYRISLDEIGLQPVRSQFLGTLDNQPCYEVELPEDTVPPKGMSVIGLRELHGILEDDLFALSSRAVQLKEWDRTHQYCGHCATPTVQLPNERAKRCPKCKLVNYPRLSPAIIVLVSRGEEVLLARAPRFPSLMYSVLAGFVEPGESLEETVVREVREEVGIEVQDIHYFGSQPWPFPNSLMIGFTATYAGGEIVPDPTEIADAAWFHKHNLPQIPSRLSIARQLIDWFAASDS
jgi:NAD+ diphosphatase